jgi:hypothetical protein
LSRTPLIWFKEWIYFFVCGWSIHQKKKIMGNCIIEHSAWCKVSVIFFWMDTPSTNKTNKFIPYHLIISKYKYYGMKLYIFYDLFMHYIFYDVWVFYDIWVLRHRSMDTKSTNISTNRKACYMKNYMIILIPILNISCPIKATAYHKRKEQPLRVVQLVCMSFDSCQPPN